MRKIIVSIIAILTFSQFTSLFAAEIPNNLRALEISDTSISLDWDDVSGAIGYYLYYGTKTGSGTSYEVELVDMISKSEYTLEKLIADTDYFIAVTSMDDFGVESGYSQELEQATRKAGLQNQATSFRIQRADVIDKTTLEFFFSIDLDTSLDALQEFIIEETETGKEIGIDISEVNPDNLRSVLVLLGDALKENTSYKVKVLEIRDVKGGSIESGIDAFVNFMTPVSFVKQEDQIDKQDVPGEDMKNIEDIDESIENNLQSAGPGGQNIEAIPDEENLENKSGNTGENIEVDTNMTQTAENNTKLPQTGPAQWILLFAAFLFAGGIYFSQNRRLFIKK